MTSVPKQTSPSTPSASPGSPRGLEFASALDCYIAGYFADDLLGHRRSARVSLAGPRRPGALRQLGGLIVRALTRLGDAMSAGGRSSAVGIM